MSIIAAAPSTTPGTNYTLVVTNGTGDGVYLAGSVVTITADAPASGQHFAAWTGATVANSTSGSTTITMSGTFTVTATYAASSAPTYTLAVVNGTGDGNYIAGAVQAIVADAPATGKVFSAWTGATVASASSASTTITMPAAATTVTATYVDGPSYVLTVNSGTGDGTYVTGTVVTVVADTPAAQKVFDAWTGTAVADASKPSTTIAVTGTSAVTATYADTTGILYTLTVVNGTGSGNYLSGAVVAIVAASAPTGQVFSAWTGSTVASPSSASTTITMGAAAAAVTATYVDGPFYVLTVVNGSGDGSYLGGAVVTITADAPTAGQVFNGWTGATVADAAAASTTITVSTVTTVTATYTAAATFTLTVISGTGGGNFAAASVNAIVANAPATGKVFSAWTGDTAALTNPAASSTNATMPSAPVTVTATYVDGPFFVLTVTNGSGDGSYLGGSVVTITADAPANGKVFSLWTGASVADATKPSTTLTVTTTTTVVATYVDSAPPTYTLTVVQGTGDGNYVAASVNAIVADAPTTGHVFSAWTGGGSSIANASAASTTITMPAAPLTVTATYVNGPFYTLVVNSGTGDGSYLAGAVVTIVADAPPAGQVFSAWTGATVASSSSPSTTIAISGNATVTATYINNPARYTLVVTNGSGDGNYAQGTVVTITADAAPTGQVFSAWTGGTVASASSSTTTVTMPAAAVTVVATYVNVTVTGTFYVSTTGSDANNGTTLATPFRTLTKGVSVLAPGNTLFVRAGTYDESLLYNIPSGTSWNNKVRIANYNGEVVLMKPSDPQAFRVMAFAGNGPGGNSGSQHYIEIDGINMDGSAFVNAGANVVKIESAVNYNAHHIRLQNCEMIGSTIPTGTGLSTNTIILITDLAFGNVGFHEILNVVGHHAGGVGSGGYFLYLQASDCTVDTFEAYDVRGAGISIYNGDVGDSSASRNTITNGHIHDVHQIASDPRTQGIVVGRGSDNVLSHLLIEDIESSQAYGIDLYHCFTTSVVDCTIQRANHGVIVEAGATDTTLTGNTSTDNATYDYLNQGVNTVSSGNSWD